MKRILIIAAVFGMLLGAYIGKASGETLSITNLKVGDKLPQQTLWDVAPDMASKIEEWQEAEVVWINEDKTEMELKVVDVETDKDITAQEFYNRVLKVWEK